MSRLSKGDPFSFSEPENVVTRHIDFFWNIDFEKNNIHGEVLMQLDVIANEINHLILDVNDLAIEEIAIQRESDRIPLNFNISDQNIFGAKLRIDLPTKTSGNLLLAIVYASSSTASALQWLKPEQTLGKQQPYMYSQCHAIHARSILPCQDTGAVKFTFRAEITHPAELTALMSGVRVSSENGKTIYEQTVPIPSNLLAIAVGPLVSRSIGPISKIWCEEALVDESAEEFSETPRMLATAEEICGPYDWKVYDVLVLPPNYLYSGMEYPCLAYLSPTLLAGDKSLAYVLAHEMSHCWTGNLVTNRNLEQLWLNAGFSMFIEGKILGRVFGAQMRDYHAVQFLGELQDIIEDQFKNAPEMTKMVVDMTGIHPDSVFSMLPFVKGQNFLRYLEDLLGGPAIFEPFVRYYIQKFKNKSVDSNDFKATLEEYFAGKASDKLASLDWDLWLYGEGGVPILPRYDTSISDTIREQTEIWKNNTVENIKKRPDLKSSNFLVFQSMGLLAQLVREQINVEITEEWIQLLEKTYGLAGTKNFEVLLALCRLYIKGRLFSRLDLVLKFVNRSGTIRYTRPIYRALNEWPEAKPKAVANFLSVENQLMPCVAMNIRNDLGLESAN